MGDRALRNRVVTPAIAQRPKEMERTGIEPVTSGLQSL
jgi:hypothetical protein